MVFLDGARGAPDERVVQPNFTVPCKRLHYNSFFIEEGVTVVFLFDYQGKIMVPRLGGAAIQPR